MEITQLKENLEKRGFGFAFFETRAAAADYLEGKLDGAKVGIGGSVTVQEMGLYEKLSARNQVAWHWQDGDLGDANSAPVYISSLNGVAQTGELINIDGSGNRVSATAYGATRVYFLVGKNKLAPDFEGALWRARNIAGPKNAARLGKNTPCVKKESRCYDCQSPERICRELLVLWGKPLKVEEMEVILVDEELGF